jgi:hypothetical protein
MSILFHKFAKPNYYFGVLSLCKIFHKKNNLKSNFFILEKTPNFANLKSILNLKAQTNLRELRIILGGEISIGWRSGSTKLCTKYL